MAGNIFWKEGSTVTVTSVGTSFASGLLVNCGQFDNSSTGSQPQYFVGRASFNAQWNSTSGIVNGTNICDMYMVPRIDRTNAPAVGSSLASPNGYIGSFICATNTIAASSFVLFDSPDFELRPWLYDVYLINQSGQAIASSWTLKLITAEAQYT